MSQCANIWQFLQDGGTLTPKEAYDKFGTLSLHSRISELRERGHPIDCELVRVGDKTVGRYSMLRIAHG